MNQTADAPKINPAALRTVIIIVSLVMIAAFFISRDMDGIRTFLLDTGVLGVLASVLLYGVLGASPIPSEPFTVFLTTIYGPLVVTLLAATGNVLAALVEFFIGMKIGDAADFEKRRQKLPFGLGKLPVNSLAFLLVARTLPGYGPKFVSVIGGIYKVSFWRYLWTAAVSNLIGAAIFSFGGYELLNFIKGLVIR